MELVSADIIRRNLESRISSEQDNALDTLAYQLEKGASVAACIAPVRRQLQCIVLTPSTVVEESYPPSLTRENVLERMGKHQTGLSAKPYEKAILLLAKYGDGGISTFLANCVASDNNGVLVELSARALAQVVQLVREGEKIAVSETVLGQIKELGNSLATSSNPCLARWGSIIAS